MRFGHHGRVYLAGLFTIVVLAYLVVPWVVNLIDAGRDYSPFYYEPKDATRQDYLLRRRPEGPASPWRVAVNVTLVFAVVLVWLTVRPRR